MEDNKKITVFNKGMNKDVHPQNISSGFYDEARNVVHSHPGGDTFLLNNELGFLKSSDFESKKQGFLVISAFPHGDLRIVFSIKAVFLPNEIKTLESEIGYIKNDIYTEVINDHDLTKNPTQSEFFNFNIKFPIRAKFRNDYANNIIAYWTDDNETPKSINLSTNYTLPENQFVNLSQETYLFGIFNSPICTYIRTFEGGNTKPGLYHFVARYLNDTLDPTEFGFVSQGVPVVDDFREVSRLLYDGSDFQSEATSKAIELEISNLDLDYKYVEVAVITYSGTASTPIAYLIERVRINNKNSVKVIFDGRVEEQISLLEVITTKSRFDTAKFIESKDSRLILANLSLKNKVNLQPIANSIRVKYVITEIEWTEDYCCVDGSGYYDTKLSTGINIPLVNYDDPIGSGFNDYKNEKLTFDMKGYSRDEVLSIGIVGLLKTGGYTEVFHVPAYVPFAFFPDPGEYDNNSNIYSGTGNSEGYLNGFVSEDKYDDPLNEFYYDHFNNNLHGTGIRHHLTPTHHQEPHYRVDSLSGKTYIRIMGIRIEGLNTALAKYPDVNNAISGIAIVREPRDTYSNRRIYSMGCMNRMIHWDGIKNNREEDEPAIRETMTINPFFGDTVIENSGSNDKDNSSSGNHVRFFNGLPNSLHKQAIKVGAFYSPETILLNGFEVPRSCRIVPIFRVEARLNECVPGNLSLVVTTPQYDGTPPDSYGTKDIAFDQELNPITDPGYPFIVDLDSPYVGQFLFGHYDISSSTGRLPRAPMFWLFGDFKSNPVAITDSVDSIYGSNYNQTNKLHSGVPVHNTYRTSWNNTVRSNNDIFNLKTLLLEKYKFNSYGTEGSYIIESSQVIPVSFENLNAVISELANPLIIYNGASEGFSYYPNVAKYTKLANKIYNPNFFSIRVNLNVDADSGLDNGNDFRVFTFNANNDAIHYRDIYVLKNVVTNQYKTLDGNKYVFVDVLLKNDTVRNNNQLNVPISRNIFNGDVFISKFFFRTSLAVDYGFLDPNKYWEDQHPSWVEDKLVEVFGPVPPGIQDRVGADLKAGNYYFVESEINCNYRHFPIERDEQGNISKTGVPYFPKQNKVEVLKPDAELGHSNGYNIQYSKDNAIKYFYLRPFNYRDVIYYPNTVIASQRSFEGELSDQFRIFLPTTKQDVPKTKGPITDLYVHNNSLYAHAERTLFKMFFNETSAISSNSGEEILLGDSGVFTREADEVFTIDGGYAGTLHDLANVASPFGRIFVDYHSKKIFMLTDSISEISQNGLWKFFQNAMKITNESENNANNPRGIGLIAFFDPANKRYVLSIKDFERSYTISYSFLSNSWVSFHDYIPSVVFTHDNDVISIDNNQYPSVSLFKHNKGKHGTYYDGLPASSEVVAIIRPDSDGLSELVFDNMVFEVDFENNGVVLTNEFFNRFSFWNKIQYSGIHQTVMTSNNRFDINVIYKSKAYRVRGLLSSTIDDSKDIFDPTNIDLSMQNKSRLKGKYVMVKLEYDNEFDYHFALNFIITIFRLNRL